MHLVRADRQQMAAKAADIEFHFARALYCVDVEKDASVGGDLADFRYRLQYACLIVGQHDADQTGLGANGAENVRRVDEAAWLRGNEGRFHAAMHEAPGCFQNGGVFNRRGNEVVAGGEKAKEGSVCSFCAAVIEYHFRLMTVEEFGQSFASLVDSCAGPLAMQMDGRGVAEVLHPIGAHCLDHLGKKGW